MSDIKNNEDSFHKSRYAEILENTRSFIENYLQPNKNWDLGLSPKDRIIKLKYSDVNYREVSDHIKSLTYESFLKTPYWKAITSYKKYLAGFRCQVCNSSSGLNTHHRNYEIHGYEHAHLNELVVLCHDCHNLFHARSIQTKNQSLKEFLFIVANLGLIALFCFFLLGHT